MLYLLWQIVLLQRKPLMRSIVVTNAFDEIHQNTEILMTHVSKWRYDDNGDVKIHTVSTTYRDAEHPNETIAEFDARHTAKVAADRLVFPPIAD